MREPFPDRPLHMWFFVSKTGPYKSKGPMAGKSKEYTELVQRLAGVYESERNSLIVPEAGTSIAKALTEIKQTKTSATLEKARAGAKQKASERKDKKFKPILARASSDV